ncbi:PspA/IM30 family protein [Corallococcus sp. AB049A]|uniref:PspA/IM30 family protein n=1 Tax=Corallococcus interemptor TaxID=2316720 RepID=A0A3A8QGA6_9BACT|nr:MULTISPECIES: PspA/IM30 family protein [Corallococcus]RKH49793.1 PspA/IM30 family protein [Corallococcus sp. AB050B]RKH66711.1 PspA/IM30 family protein [Corallococcus interemptor]RKI49581.1 PspA/IM30 family protein [Corallococcus sp. AB049A]
MWQRFKRAMRSFAGFFVSSIEDPELILEQNIRDLNDQVPKMNESIAMVRANVTLLEKENMKYQQDVRELTAKVKAAIQAGRDDLAGTYATKLQGEKEALARNQAQLDIAKQAYEKALNVKKAFMREKDKKTQEAMNAIRDARRAKWQAKVADTMESFTVAGVDSTHDEMLRKVQEKTAINEARMQMALESVDHTAAAIEEEAEKIQGDELVKQFKMEMGLLDSPAPVSDVGAGPEKTIGKKVEIK